MILVIDTETSGLYNFSKGHDDPSQPHMLQVGWCLCSPEGRIVHSFSSLTRPFGEYEINEHAFKAHGITKEMVDKYGVNTEFPLFELTEIIKKFQPLVVGHNIKFDMHVLDTAFFRASRTMEAISEDTLAGIQTFCTMLESTSVVKMEKPSGSKGGYKWPKLEEVYDYFFGEIHKSAHDALGDVMACKRVYFEGLKKGQNLVSV